MTAIRPATTSNSGTGLSWIDITTSPYNADKTGSATVTAAVVAAATALPSRGGVLYAPAGRYKFSTKAAMPKKPIHIVGDTTTSFNESTATGTSFITGAAAMTMLEWDGGSTILQQGPVIEGISFDDVAGGSMLIHSRLTSRHVFRTCAFRNASVGLEFDAASGVIVGGDSAWHRLDQCVFYNCATGWLATDTFGALMDGGEFTDCVIGYDGVKDRSMRFVGVKGDGGGNILFRSRGYNNAWEACHLEDTNSGHAFTGWDIDSTAGNPFGHNFKINGSVTGAGVAGHYGVKIGSGASGTVIDLWTDNIIAANRLVDNGLLTNARVRNNDGDYHYEKRHGIGVFFGSGSPEGAQTASIGDEYWRTDGPPSRYLKASGTASTSGWAEITTGAGSTSPVPKPADTGERVFTVQQAGTIGATITDGADFPLALPFDFTAQRMKVTCKTAPSGSMVVKLRRSTATGTPSYSDVTGFTLTFASGNTETVVDPTDFAMVEGDLLNVSVTTGSGAGLQVEVIGVPQNPVEIGDAIGGGADSSNTTTVAVPTGTAVAVGDQILAVFSTGANVDLSSVAGGALTWTVLVTTHHVSGAGAGFALAECPAGLASGTTITATCSGANLNKRLDLYVMKRLNSSALDQTNTRTGTNSSLQVNNVTTLQARELVIAAFVTNTLETSSSWTAGSGYTQKATKQFSGIGESLLLEYQDMRATGTYNPTATASGSSNYASIVATLKAT